MKRIFALTVLLVFCFALAACGEKKNDIPMPTVDTGSLVSYVDNSSAESDIDSGSSSVSSGTSSNSGTKKFSSIEEYLENPDVKKSFDQAMETIKQYESTLSFDYYAQGNQLHYDYTYLDQYDGDGLDTLKKNLENTINSSASNYQTIVEEMRTYIDIPNPQFVISYFNADGSLVYSRTFE